MYIQQYPSNREWSIHKPSPHPNSFDVFLDCIAKVLKNLIETYLRCRKRYLVLLCSTRGLNNFLNRRSALAMNRRHSLSCTNSIRQNLCNQRDCCVLGVTLANTKKYLSIYLLVVAPLASGGYVYKGENSLKLFQDLNLKIK